MIKFDALIILRLSQAEKKLIRRAATLEGKTMSAFIREAATLEARLVIAEKKGKGNG